LLEKKDKQAQMMVADLSPPMSVENIQLKLKQTINTKRVGVKDVLYFQMVEWYCPVTILTLSALSIKKAYNHSR